MYSEAICRHLGAWVTAHPRRRSSCVLDRKIPRAQGGAQLDREERQVGEGESLARFPVMGRVKRRPTMFVSSVRARISKDPAGAVAWAVGIAKVVQKKTGVEVQTLARVGATQDIVWLQQFPS